MSSYQSLRHSLTSLCFASLGVHKRFQHLINLLSFLTRLNSSSLKLFFSKFIIKNLSRLASSCFGPCFRSLWTWSHACAWCLWSNVSFIDSVILHNL